MKNLTCEMTQKELLDFAYHGALARWHTEKRRLDSMPDNSLAKIREQNAFKKLSIVSAMLYEAEHAENND